MRAIDILSVTVVCSRVEFLKPVMYQQSARDERETIRPKDKESPQLNNRDLTKGGSFLTMAGGSDGRIKSIQKPTYD